MAELIEDHEEEAFGVTESLVDGVLEAVDAGDAEQVYFLLDPLHPADIAHVIEQISPRERRDLLDVWKGGMDGEILSELDEGIREEIIESLAPAELAEAFRELESDDVVDLVEYLDEDQQEAVLDILEGPERVVVEKALAYPEESAGRHMQVEIVRAPEHWTVGETIDFMRSGIDLPDQFYHVVLVDPKIKPVAYATLGRILSSPRSAKLRDICEESFRVFDVNDTAADVAHAFNHYHLISAPVVDEDDRLVGVITIDDAMTLLDEEHEEDILRLAGVGEGSLSDSVLETTRQRLPWLGVNLVTAILASMVISLFETTISGLVALAVLMPIVASMGGNAGTQTVTVAVRALALRQLSRATIMGFVLRELSVGFINGLIFAITAGLVSYFWFGDMSLALVMAVAMLANLVIAGVSGTAIPLTLTRFGVDPAVASSVFITTVTDVVGFMTFLGLAAYFLL
ncbi:MAG: magnesium transporter [Marivivens sp.]|nr:magnesium transporter [Marivivens sp.]